MERQNAKTHPKITPPGSLRQLDDLDAYSQTIYIESEYGRITVKGFKEKLNIKTGRSEPEVEKPHLSFFEFIGQELKEMEKRGMRRSSFGPYKLHADILREFAKEQALSPLRR